MKTPNYDFKFNLPEMDPELRREANLRLVQLLTLAPPGAKALGAIEKQGNHYVSIVEVTSPYRSFSQQAGGLTPQASINRVLDRLEDSIHRWRYGGVNQGAETNSHFYFNHRQTQ